MNDFTEKNDITEKPMLLNDRSVRKRTKRWKTNYNFENKRNLYFEGLKKANEMKKSNMPISTGELLEMKLRIEEEKKR